MRKTRLANNEFYHVYNRGVEKRRITLNKDDSDRLVQSLIAFNSAAPIGSIYSHSFKNAMKLSNRTTKFEDPLVEIVSYCFNPNHFHLLLKQVSDNGISKFMQKFGTGFTRYFNEKYDRTGVLFQGKFKARRINSDADLLRMSAYVNLNDKVHNLRSPVTKYVRSSWEEYANNRKGFCVKDIILGQFDSSRAYVKFARSAVREIVRERAKVDKSEYQKLKREFYGKYFD